MELNKINSIGRKVGRIQFGIVAIIFGLIFAGIGGFITYKSFTTEYLPVEAEISSEGYFENSDNEIIATISYYVNGEKYENEWTVNSSQLEEGKITLFYDVNNPNSLSSDDTPIIPIVFASIGVLCVVFGIISLVKNKKDKHPDLLNQVDTSNIDPNIIEEIKNNDEPSYDYNFYFVGKLGQSYILETKDRTPVIKIDCEKTGIVKKSIYKVTNYYTGKIAKYEVGHTVTVSFGSGHLNIPYKSTFTVNGEDVFSMIAKIGYSITAKLEGLKINFDVFHYGIKVASLNCGGVNIKTQNKYGKLGNIPTKGIYVINAKKSDLDAVALIAFAVSRVDFF